MSEKHSLFFDPTEHRIRSFVTRAGRLSHGQAKAIEQWGPDFCVPYQKKPMDCAHIFQREAPTILEIGFGMGDGTAHISGHFPERNFLGVEVHTPGVGNLLKLIHEHQLTNTRIIRHDAFEVLTHMLEPKSLAGVHIFFPDPWHKARHHKRRMIQTHFVELLADRLIPGGYIHCATDWEHYAEHMLEVFSGAPNLMNTAKGYAPRPDYRPVTKFERRGVLLGHGVWDLIFKRRDDSKTPL